MSLRTPLSIKDHVVSIRVSIKPDDEDSKLVLLLGEGISPETCLIIWSNIARFKFPSYSFMHSLQILFLSLAIREIKDSPEYLQSCIITITKEKQYMVLELVERASDGWRKKKTRQQHLKERSLALVKKQRKKIILLLEISLQWSRSCIDKK